MTSVPGERHFLSNAAGWAQTWGLAIDGATDWLADDVTLAGDSRTRRVGLLGRHDLAPGCGLVLAPCQGIHTFGMRFAIDVVGVARDGQVVSIARDVPPWRISLSWRAFAIVELRAGRSHDVGLQIGARLEARQCHPWTHAPMLGARIL